MIRHPNPQEFEIINDIGTNSYPCNYYEGFSSFYSKIVGYLDGCYVYTFDETIIGYIVSFPYKLNMSYPINEDYKPENNPDCYYLHDLCIDYFFRGQGFGKELVEKILEIDFYPKALTAVMESEQFWTKFGFKTQKRIDYYGKPASYMLLGK